MNGSDDPSNLINLTINEHAEAQWYYNPNNKNDTKMIKMDAKIPDGWEKGRPKVKNRINIEQLEK